MTAAGLYIIVGPHRRLMTFFSVVLKGFIVVYINKDISNATHSNQRANGQYIYQFCLQMWDAWEVQIPDTLTIDLCLDKPNLKSEK